MVPHLRDGVRERVVRRGDRPALAGGDDLARMEAEAAGNAEPAARASAVARSECPGSVFEQRHVGQLMQTQGAPEEMHAEQQLRPRADCDLRRVDVHRHGVDVDEDGLQPRERDDVGGGRERVGRDEHLVARLEARREDGEMERSSAGGDDERVLDLAEARDLRLELGDLRAHREHPAREDLGDLGELRLAHVGPT